MNLEFHLLRPWWLLALMPWAYCVSVMLAAQKGQNNWSKLVDAHLLKHLLTTSARKSHQLILTTVALFGLLIIVILCGVSFKQIKVASYQKEDPIVLAVDLSEKMKAMDLKPSRMERAKFKLNDLIKTRLEGQTGLVAFSNDAFVASPLSSDAKTLSTMIAELSPEIVPIEGQNIKRALEESANLIKQAGFSQGKIILITTGPANVADIKEASQLSRDNIKTSVLAVATKTGAPIASSRDPYLSRTIISKLDEKSLQELAGAGGGNYSELTLDNRDLDALLKEDLTARKSLADETLTTWADNSRLFIFFLLPFALYAFRRGFVENYLP